MNFTHLEQKKQSYFSHLKCTLNMAYKMLFAATAVVIHGIYPDVLQTKASSIIDELHESIHKKSE